MDQFMEKDDQRRAFENRMKQEQVNRCRDMAGKLKILFFIKIASIVMVALAMASTINTAVVMGTMGVSESVAMASFNAIALVFVLASLALGIVYGVMLMAMGRYMPEFSGAGLFTIISSVLSTIHDFTGHNIFNILSIVFSILCIMRFADGMKTALSGYSVNNSVDSELAYKWGEFKALNIKMLIVTGVCVVVAIIPIINLLVILPLLIVLVVAVVLSIWQLILIYKSSVSMNEYVPI